MSAQGRTLRAPIRLPIRAMIVALLAATAALGIGLGVRELVQDPARPAGSVVEFDWGSRVGHPQIRHNESSETPPQRVYPDGFGDADPTDVPSGFRSHQQI